MRRGFMLMELLAVIVILSIISLIAIPMITNIITDSKEKSNKEGLNLYIDTVSKRIANSNLDILYNPDICTIQSTGDLLCLKDDEELYVDEEKTNKILKIEMKGTTPSEGKLYFTNGKIVTGKNILYNGLYYQIKNGIISEGTKEKKALITKVYLADIPAVGANKIKHANGNEISSTVGNFWQIPYVEGIHIVTGTNKGWVENNYPPFLVETNGTLIVPEYTGYENETYFSVSYKYETILTGYDKNSTIYINTNRYLDKTNYRELVYYEFEDD